MSRLKITNARGKQRVRLSLRRTASGRPRLSVFRSSKHIYAQVIDDLKGETLASASSLEKAMRESGNTGEHRRGQGGRQAAGGACGEERRHRSGVRSRRLSLSRPRQGARGCGPRERIEFLNGLNWHRASQGKSFKDRKTPWQVNANAVAATGAAGKNATASSSTSSSTSIVWRRSSRAASASALRRWS